MRFLLCFLALTLVTAPPFARAVNPIPPPGVPVPDADRTALTAGVAALGKEIDSLRSLLKARPEMLALLPDVMIFHKAVDWALRYDEFFEPKHIDAAKQQLDLGMQRARELRDGKPSWNSATGLVVRGYLSKIDGSVQPYGLIVPDDWKPAETTPRRLDFWFRGRAEKSTELAFLADRMKNKGEFTPPGAFVLHPFGRYCCANKFAGERDLFEALENARQHYRIDPARMSVRGFSMGGASAWQFGTHFAGLWAAVAPGAGFGETAEFCRVLGPGKTPPPPWEQTLWRWYDSTDYVANLANTTTVAYSGELDGQKQAADIMLSYAEKEGLTIPHIIGPQTKHAYHPESKPKIEEIVTAAAVKGRATDREVRFTTYSLIYPEMEWVKVESLEKQWERADIKAQWDGKGIVVETKNVAALRLNLKMRPVKRGGTLTIDGSVVEMTIPPDDSDSSLRVVAVNVHKENNRWVPGMLTAKEHIGVKNSDTCGPIDHAFMSSFLFVRPTGKPLNDKVGAWTKAELEHATGFWRRVFRGDAPVKDDTALTADDVANSNLILWGDPSSNAAIKKLIDRLPIRWTAQELVLEDKPQMNTDEHGSKDSIRVPSVNIRGSKTSGKTYDAAHHAPVLIFPNPANPQKYIVINSGPTFREEALLNNAQQVAKLPDWAIIDLDTPPDARNPGLVLDAGFFDEQWKPPGK